MKEKCETCCTRLSIVYKVTFGCAVCKKVWCPNCSMKKDIHACTLMALAKQKDTLSASLLDAKAESTKVDKL